MNPQDSRENFTIAVTNYRNHAYAPRSVDFIDIDFVKGSEPEICEGKLRNEIDVLNWLKQEEGQDVAVKSSFRLLYGQGYITLGRDDLNLPFSPELFDIIKEGFKLPAELDRILEQEATRCVRNKVYDQQGNFKGLSSKVQHPLESLWLTRRVKKLFASNGEATVLGELIRLVKLNAHRCQRPYVLPVLICDLFAQLHAIEIHKATRKVFGLERSIGMHDYPVGRHPSGVKVDEDFSMTSRKLNGQLSRLENYEKWITSHINLLKVVLGYEEFSDAVLSANVSGSREDLKEYAAQLLHWNTDLLSQAACQIKIVQAQIQTVYTLLAQRDNKLNIAIAAASKRDSAAMKTIAVLTMVFLPGAYIAALFSMNMFDWHAHRASEVLSGHFWVYWAITIPVTALVLTLWAVWSKPWRR